jgi:hypothetical protein
MPDQIDHTRPYRQADQLAAEERAWVAAPCTCDARKVAPQHKNECAKWTALRAVTEPDANECKEHTA